MYILIISLVDYLSTPPRDKLIECLLSPIDSSPSVHGKTFPPPLYSQLLARQEAERKVSKPTVCQRKTARFLPLLTRSGILTPVNLSFQACDCFSLNSRCFASFHVPLIMKQPNLLAEVQKGRTLMHARVIFAQFRPEQTDEIIQLYRESVVPEHRKQQGSKGTMVLIDRASGKGISITFWETEADLQASDEASPYYQELRDKFAPYWTVPQVREAYEVTLQE